MDLYKVNSKGNFSLCLLLMPLYKATGGDCLGPGEVWPPLDCKCIHTDLQNLLLPIPHTATACSIHSRISPPPSPPQLHPCAKSASDDLPHRDSKEIPISPQSWRFSHVIKNPLLGVSAFLKWWDTVHLVCPPKLPSALTAGEMRDAVAESLLLQVAHLFMVCPQPSESELAGYSELLILPHSNRKCP